MTQRTIDACEAYTTYERLIHAVIWKRITRNGSRQSAQYQEGETEADKSRSLRNSAGSHTARREDLQERKQDALARFFATWQEKPRTDEEERLAVVRTAWKAGEPRRSTVGSTRTRGYVDALDSAKPIDGSGAEYIEEERGRTQTFTHDYVEELPLLLKIVARHALAGYTQEETVRETGLTDYRVRDAYNGLRSRVLADSILAEV